jgi:hypothetical protein
MSKLDKFKEFALTKEEQSKIQGGVTRAEYCSTLNGLMRTAFNEGRERDVKLIGDAWKTNCQPYGM